MNLSGDHIPDDATTAAAVAAANSVGHLPLKVEDTLHSYVSHDHHLQPHAHHQSHQHHSHTLAEQHHAHQLAEHHHPHVHHDQDHLNAQISQLSQHQLAQHSLAQQLQHPLSQLNHSHHHLEMLAQANEADLLEATSRKVAPRSSDLFKVGPQFSETRHHQDIYCKSNDMDVNPILGARIDRGFEMGETGTWIGYKRNYFTLVSSFTFENFDFERFLHNKFYTYEKSSRSSVGENKVEISYFAIRLVAKCSDDDVSISLIQHTPKRDKGPQFPPPIYPAVPGNLPDHSTVRASCNKRNNGKIENMNKIFYFDRAEYYHNANLNALKDNSVLKNYPSDSIARVARFERIQFSSSIRIKSTSVNSRYFTLHVELLGIIEDEDSQIQPILLSSIETPPLIVRGRSPSNYHKDRTSGYRPHGPGH
ncbi:hypothetical protein PGUG_02096 [Meyerozyma guilliermondii ATCC 6260]|uniref:NDT80 domain-containing protein n=1 Tax=Meyerozyma guilliermondii (strain ATCC 6260 / CBS 566 / DSM 6381 / JCM 1539 / NBRC 10279 / NRRL Y-324) TaxID=294746 RepID=A5DFP5_PICGU|nr:uncharacterized protein PGUG_02096 [Meyerozyma guilliermondii ATCC 6260]EDK37998.2 hypothetical protein PGUG_02096 [Meyerozyma guilliermondii ATCC 6260]